jgi:hypothetical protein
MKLERKYIIGVHVMFYEIEMLHEYIESCLGMLKNIKNPDNVSFHFTWNTSEHFERIDTTQINVQQLDDRFFELVAKLTHVGAKIIVERKTNDDSVYNIADYRRDLNYNYCTEFDFVLWGETDSLWPRETLALIESLDAYVSSHNINKYVIVFSDRKMWDYSWKCIEHDDFTDVTFIDDDTWPIENIASSKSYMTLEQMYEINDKANEPRVDVLSNPKFDGSCLVIKSDLIKSGVNIPQSLLCSGEDTSFADMAKLILGNDFKQFVIKNILRVHNRRHPRKRLYIDNENNPRGFCGKGDKGDWWSILQTMSKQNLATLRRQSIIYTMQDVFNEIERNNNENAN